MKGSQRKVLIGKFRKTRKVGKPRTRWEDVIRRDTSQILGIRGWRRRTEDREECGRLLREVVAPYMEWNMAYGAIYMSFMSSSLDSLLAS